MYPPNTFSMILASLICSTPSHSLELHPCNPIDYHVMCGLSLDLGHVDHLFDMLQGNMLDVIRSLLTFGGYNPSLDPFSYIPSGLT